MDKIKNTVLDGSNEDASKRLEELIKQYESEDKENNS